MEYMPTKNLETFMKSRQDFTTEKDYQDYLRTYFAAMALQGICSTFSGSPNAERQAEKVGKTLSETMAVYAVDVADALINALNEKP